MCRQVSWVRRQDNGEKVNLLTVGQQTYIGDPRYTVKFQYPDNWRLQIRPVNSSDEGQYECQVSTHPPKYIHVNLHINGKYRNNSLLSIVKPASSNTSETSENYHETYVIFNSTFLLLLSITLRFYFVRWWSQ